MPKFQDIIGHATGIALLQKAIAENDLPQSLLIAGPEGVGKTTLVLALTQRLCCQNPVASDSCGTCVNCQRIERGEHPDIVRIAPDGEQTKIWQFWSRPGHPPGALETLPFAPVAAPARIYILEKAETLNEESANSLLKALEEPPPYVRFFVCAPAPDAVLQTIRSRCRIVRLSPVPSPMIAGWLTTAHGLSADAARLWATYAQGSPGRALRLAQSPEAEAQRARVADIGERIAQATGVAAFRLAEDLREAAKGGGKKSGGKTEEGDEPDRTARGDLARTLEMLALWYGDVIRIATGGPNAPILHAERRDGIVSAATRYKPEQIVVCIENLFTFRRHIQRNANSQLATEALLLRLIPRRTAS